MDNLQQEQRDLIEKGLKTVPIDKLTAKIESVLRLRKDPLNASQIAIVLLNVIIGMLTEVVKKNPPGPQKDELERMIKECNDMVLTLAYSIGVHLTSKLEEK